MSVSILSGDFTVYFTNDTGGDKQIRWTGTATGTRSVNELYSALEDLFDDDTAGVGDYMDEGIPMKGITPVEYQIGRIETNDGEPWFIDPETIKHLTGGAIASVGWTRVVSSDIGIVKVAYTTGTDFIEADIGKSVVTTADEDQGRLLHFDGSTAWIRPDDETAGNSFDATTASDTITVTAGSAASVTQSSASTTGEMIWSNVYTLGSIQDHVRLYIAQDNVEIDNWWGEGHFDILVLTTNQDVLIDSGDLTVYARQGTKLYDHFIIDVGAGGRNAVPLATSPDTNNLNGYRSVSVSSATATFEVGELVSQLEFVDVYYFDASDAGPTDTGGDYTNDSNAFDGSTSTSATGTGTSPLGAFTAEGTNAGSTSYAVTSVRFRAFGKIQGVSPSSNVNVYEDGDLGGSSLGFVSLIDSPTAGWTDWKALSAPVGGWSWAEVQALEVSVSAIAGLGDPTVDIYRIEIEVTSGHDGGVSVVTENTGSPTTSFEYYLVGDTTKDYANGELISGSIAGINGTTGTPANAGASGYTDVTVTFGWDNTFDIDDDGTVENYSIVIDCNSRPLDEVYERLKNITRRGETSTLNGIEGQQYIGADYRVDYLALTGTIATGSTVTQSILGATATVTAEVVGHNTTDDYLMLRDTRGGVIEFGTGAANLQIDGSNYVTMTSTATTEPITPVKVSPFGTLAGGRFFGARGVVLDNVATGDINNYEVISDGGVTYEEPVQVATSITVVDANTQLPLENARVILGASDGTGDLGYQDTVTITRVTTTATVAHNAHPYIVGSKVNIVGDGTTENEYTGAKTITAITTNSYDYTVTGTPTTPASGTITSTGLILEGLTNASGEISDTRAISTDQPIVGHARKSTTSPFYKTSTIAGILDSVTGYSQTVSLILDE